MLHGIMRNVVTPSLLLFVCMNLVIGCMGPVSTAPVGPTPTVSNVPAITIHGTTKYQTIDGFGISEAFGQANLLRQLPLTVQRQVLDDLFSTSTGAGLNILRNQIFSSSDATIEPSSPGSPAVAPTYVWDRDDQGQVWLSQLIKKQYGITQLYANAWSAPKFMKTNGSETNGGQLCGSPGASSCSSGDWRQAYANYLVRYLQDYQAEGITIPYIGFANEPDLSIDYSSMQMSPQQADDFVKILGPTLKNTGLSTSTQIICCDSETWLMGKDHYIPTIANDRIASSYIPIYSSHGYIHSPNAPLISPHAGKNIWQTEWGNFTPWINIWDQGDMTPDHADSGFIWAQHIYTALTAANVSAFFYWWGAASDSKNQSLIRFNGSSVDVSKRLWAFANYSRFVRPGAIRIGATTSDNKLLVTAFSNTDGSLAIVVLNTAMQAMTVPITLSKMGISSGQSVVPYVTDSTNNTAKQDALTITNGGFSAKLPARSLVTYTLAAKRMGA